MLKHGEFTAEYIQALELENTPPTEPNPDTLHGVIKIFDKRIPVTLSPSAFNNVSAVHRNAICIRDSASAVQAKGVALWFCTMALVPFLFVYDIFFEDLIRDVMNPGIYNTVFWLIYLYLLFFIFPRWIWAYVRLDLFPPEDQPIILDRQHRKIYKLLPPLDGSSEQGWARFRSIPLQAVEYDWNHVTAEHRVQLSGTGRSVVRSHSLVMVVRDRRKPGEEHGRLLDEFSVGGGAASGPAMVEMWWEHLRRYMETNGPGVPDDEPLHVFERPKTLWQSMGVVSPFGPRLLWWWETSRFFTAFFLVLFPIFLPFFTGWAICNWISHKTMRDVIWPQEVLDRIGPVIRRAD